MNRRDNMHTDKARIDRPEMKVGLLVIVSTGVVVYSHPVSQGCFGHSLSSPLRGATAEFDGVASQRRLSDSELSGCREQGCLRGRQNVAA
ncbi:hypothetical protein [Rhizobium ruizarguesonis]|uniref:hypothetical protein n=1 Tax=Rhizobium ruizarguesonis TaxID=2081791 RepID=UPI00102FB105|nr:hypothetical protein [Rhizobium ruizarguesonis]TBC19534.1 hypothetical protein ELH34_04875 [Rhizobium ruizarguesonis]